MMADSIEAQKMRNRHAFMVEAYWPVIEDYLEPTDLFIHLGSILGKKPWSSSILNLFP